jgi:starch synthase (maltosyl-transferring)
MSDLADPLSRDALRPVARAIERAGSFAAYLEGDPADAQRAAALGFRGLVTAPFGSTLRWQDGASWKAPDLGADLELVVFLPWAKHHPESSLRREAPHLFKGQDRDLPVVDPRRFDGTRRSDLLLGDHDVLGIYARRLADFIAGLEEGGADAVLLPGADLAPGPFWAQVAEGLPERAIRLFGRPLDASATPAESFDAWVTSDFRERGSERGPARFFASSSRAASEPEGLLQALVTADGAILNERQLGVIGPDDTKSLLSLAAEIGRPDRALFEFGPGEDIRRLEKNGALAFSRDARSALRAFGGRYLKTQQLFSTKRAVIMRGRGKPTKATAGPKSDSASMDKLAKERVAIENIYPTIDGGRFPAKRIVGDVLEVGADIFSDGHEKLAADLLITEPGQDPVRVPMKHQGNDRWTARHTLERQGLAQFDIEAWRDRAESWRDEVRKKMKAGQNVGLELREGTALLRPQLEKISGGKGDAAKEAKRILRALDDAGKDEDGSLQILLSDGLHKLLRGHGDRHQAIRLRKPLEIRVDREAARFSSWYELFPRSMSPSEDQHGTFRDVIDRLPYIKDLGFDVLYFPPIHPIGKTNRKGKNNSLKAKPGDVGSPYAIGSDEGGHDALHPELGSFEDFAALVDAAREHGIEIALDFAIQCSPDHPWLKEHKEWFDWRPDGSLKFAENPPKKYEDIVNVHFYRDAYPDIWYALRDVVLFWCEKGVKIFRVDNPHTKPYPFWEWMIAEVKEAFPDALFLSEAFTRPKVMKRLAKLGFTQSYTYFTWRNEKHELTDYLQELTKTDSREVMNPNFFVNTPDINPPVLQTNNRDAYIARTWLAGTLASSYGIYNGVEIAEGTPLPGKEEYLDSEKYQITSWDMDRPGHIKDEIRLLNRLRINHACLRDHLSLRFLTAYNDRILWYAKATPDLADVLLFAVSLDFEKDQHAALEIPLWFYGLSDDASVKAYDIFADQHFTWHGKMQEVTLGPGRIVRAFSLQPPEGFEGPDGVLFDDQEGF